MTSRTGHSVTQKPHKFKLAMGIFWLEKSSIDLTTSAECTSAVRQFHADSSSEKLLCMNSVQIRSVLRGIMQTVQEQRFPPITDYFLFYLFALLGRCLA